MIVTYINKQTNDYQIIDTVSLVNAIERIWTDSESDKELLFIKRNRIARYDTKESSLKLRAYQTFDSYLIVQLHEFNNKLSVKYDPFKNNHVDSLRPVLSHFK